MYSNTDEIKQSVGSGDNSNLQVLLVILSVVAASIFIGETLFGKNSLEVYLSLKDNKKEFAKKIDKIQHENAALQKEYFELKSLLPKDEKN
jgi:cell division protein FtsB